jgi:hypothetical protein
VLGIVFSCECVFGEESNCHAKDWQGKRCNALHEFRKPFPRVLSQYLFPVCNELPACQYAEGLDGGRRDEQIWGSEGRRLSNDGLNTFEGVRIVMFGSGCMETHPQLCRGLPCARPRCRGKP